MITTRLAGPNYPPLDVTVRTDTIGCQLWVLGVHFLKGGVMQHIIDVLNQVSDATVTLGGLVQVLVAFFGGVLAHKKISSPQGPFDPSAGTN